ncbi:MAG TPA: oxidoreductase-like domain-containing protein [Telluria sp.]
MSKPATPRSSYLTIPIRPVRQPPVAPDLEDCCRSGCQVCVFDLYEAALERYEAWLAASRLPKP